MKRTTGVDVALSGRTFIGQPCALVALALLAGLPHQASAQHQDVERPAEWENLAFGGRFMNRFEKIPLLGERTAETWGADAVKPRDVLNGIEEGEWSYWGGNILEGDEGGFHMFVCRWPENHPKGHMAWHGSEVVRAVSDNRFGPFKAVEVLGRGHNPEAYRLKDGRYVCYVIDAYYLGETITGPWERKEFEFEARNRKIVAGLSNISFEQRDDGSFLMVNRGGGMWVSKDGLSTWEQVTQGSNYPKVKGRYEDPVLWRTAVQYHMIVNDWFGRIAYHLRSKDGVHWKVDAGEAYLPGIAVSEDGRKDDWYKFERIKVFQDDYGRAIQANFAVIDSDKRKDKPNDIHSSKNIGIPLTAGRLITLLSGGEPNKPGEMKVRIAAEEGFDPHQDIDLDSLKFGAPEEVDFGRGSALLRTEKEGDDLIAIFDGKEHGFADHSFAGKLLGKTAKGGLLFGYCRLSWVDYKEPIVTVRRPSVAVADGKRVMTIELSNHGQVDSKPSEIQIEAEGVPVISETAPALKPYEKKSIEVVLPDGIESGKTYGISIRTGLDLQQPSVYFAKDVKIP